MENQDTTDEEDDAMLSAYINNLYLSDSLILESTDSESTASNIEECNNSNRSTGTGGFDSIINLKSRENIWEEEAKSMLFLILFNFCKKNELLQTPTEQSPYEYFRMFLTDSFLDLVVNETNHYGEEIVFSKTNISSRSRIIRWNNIITLRYIHLIFCDNLSICY